MIGFYDYTVILTYAGALAGMLGIVMSVHGLYVNAILCMAVALVCDTLDGIVARKKKNRTKNEMLFGIQIDSLCDLISFGVCSSGESGGIYSVLKEDNEEKTDSDIGLDRLDRYAGPGGDQRTQRPV